jgi:serine/threonine protein kinase
MRVCPRCRSIYSVAVERCGIDGELVVEQVQDPLVGTDIDRYHVIAPIGKGAMGCVYRARHNVLPTECAIKVLYGNFAVNQRLIERFRREAQAIGQMSHPNIVSVIDFGSTPEGLTFLVMELVGGMTLEKIISRDAPLEPARAAHVARQLASGLSEAHRRGFVHRDVKPANIMVRDDEGFEVVKILDFGVVGMLQAAAAAKLTAAGHIVGTPSYMAPEQARTSSVSPAADLYALGCILYEMLSGLPPFEGMGVAEVLLKHINEKPRPLGEARGLEKIAMWLLEKDPEKRPSSALRVIAEIDRLDLGTANTEQILVSRVKAAVSLFREHDQTDPTPVFNNEEPDTADLPVQSRLVAPLAPSLLAELPDGSKTTQLESKTEIDFALAKRSGLNDRPALDQAAPVFSASAMDTEKPAEQLLQSETVRDTPRAPRLRQDAGTLSLRTLAVLIVLLLLATAAMVVTVIERR